MAIADAAALVRNDSVASIGNKGLLGDKLLDISVGAGEAVAPGATLLSETPVGLGEYLTRAGVIITEVEAAAENVRRATEPLAEEQFANDLRETTHNLALITRMAANEDDRLNDLLSVEDDRPTSMQDSSSKVLELA